MASLIVTAADGVREMDDEAAREVAAMQFAGGMPVAKVAEQWERDVDWVEGSIRRALLEFIPRHEGGLKMTRAEIRHASAQAAAAMQNVQRELVW